MVYFIVKYFLQKEKKKTARKAIKVLYKKIDVWKEEKEKAIESRKHSPAKFYANITSRIKYADKQITDIENRIKEFEKALKEGYIEI